MFILYTGGSQPVCLIFKTVAIIKSCNVKPFYKPQKNIIAFMKLDFIAHLLYWTVFIFCLGPHKPILLIVFE